MTGKSYVTVYPPLGPEAQAKLEARAKETTRELVKAIAADYGISEADAAQVLAQVEHEALWGPSPLEGAFQKLLTKKPVPE